MPRDRRMKLITFCSTLEPLRNRTWTTATVRTRGQRLTGVCSTHEEGQMSCYEVPSKKQWERSTIYLLHIRRLPTGRAWPSAHSSQLAWRSRWHSLARSSGSPIAANCFSTKSPLEDVLESAVSASENPSSKLDEETPCIRQHFSSTNSPLMSKRVLAAKLCVAERKLNRVMSWLARASNLSDRQQRRRVETLIMERLAGQDMVLFTDSVRCPRRVRVSVPRADSADAVESQTQELHCDAFARVQGTEYQLTLGLMRVSGCPKNCASLNHQT